MIEVTQLSKRYGKLTAVDIPELKIPDGQSFGLVGNNGAGKTTFFSLILDLIKATTGDVKGKWFVQDNDLRISNQGCYYSHFAFISF